MLYKRIQRKNCARELGSETQPCILRITKQVVYRHLGYLQISQQIVGHAGHCLQEQYRGGVLHLFQKGF